MAAGNPPQSQAVYQDGTPIPSDKLADALAKGEAGYVAGSSVVMVGPDGKRFDTTAEAVPNAIAAGYRPESPEETKASDLKDKIKQFPVLGPVLAASTAAVDANVPRLPGVAGWITNPGRMAVESAAEALAPPGSPSFAETAKAAQEVNPVATGVGTLGGVALGGVAGLGEKAFAGVAGGIAKAAVPGLTPVAEFATKEGLALAPRVGQGVLKGATIGAAETSAFSMNEELARSTLARDEITLERVLAAGGKGLGVGAIVGGPLGGIGVLGKSALERAAESKFLNPNVLAVRSIGFSRADMKRLGPERIEQIGKWMNVIQKENEATGKVGTLTLKGLDERVAVATEEAKRYGEEMLSHIKTIDSNFTPNWKGFVGEATETQPTGVLSQYLSDLRSGLKSDIELADYLEREYIGRPSTDVLESMLTRAERAEKELPKGVNVQLSRANSYEDLWNLRKQLDNDAKWDVRSTRSNDELAKIRKFRDLFETELNGQLDANAARLGIEPVWQELKKNFSSAIEVSKIGKLKVAGDLANKPLGVGEMFGAYEGATHAARLGLTGAVGGLLGLTAVKTLKAVGSENTAAAMARILNRIRGGTDKTAVELSSTIDKALTQKSVATRVTDKLPVGAAKIMNQFMTVSDSARQMKTNPEVATSRISAAVEPLAKIDTGLARAATQKLTGDLEWLASKLMTGEVSLEPIPAITSSAGVPRSKGKGGRVKASVATRTDSRMPVSIAAQFVRYEKELSDPLAGVKRMVEGKGLSPELVEVLNERRPALKEQIVAQTFDTLSGMARRGQIPGHTARVEMSMLTGAPLDVTMTPEFIQMSQTVWETDRQAMQQPQGQGQGGPPPSRHVPQRLRDRAADHASAGDQMEKEPGE